MPQRVLSEQSVDPDPIRQFRFWLEEASASGIVLPEAVALATATQDGRPSVRFVLLKGVDENGFVFFTNYRSRKGRELEENPRAELAFWWGSLERQVRVEGTVTKIAEADSDEYFQSRPRESQIGALASAQSTVVASRAELELKARELEAKFEGKKIPRPPHWGGFRIVPEAIEFWQGREGRLHDRLLYRRGTGGKWRIERLAP